MTTPDGLTALDKAWRELEADALASDGPIRDSDVKGAISRNRAGIEAAAVARHVRETGCHELVGAHATLVLVLQEHAPSPTNGVLGVWCGCGWNTIGNDGGMDWLDHILDDVRTRRAALAPTVAASEERPWKHYGVQPGCTHECHYTGWNTSGECCAECWVEPTPSPATEAERQGGEDRG